MEEVIPKHIEVKAEQRYNAENNANSLNEAT